MNKGYHRQAVRSQLAAMSVRKTAKTYADLRPLAGVQNAHVMLVMNKWDNAFVSKVAKVAQAKLLTLTEKRMGRRPEGGGRALLQFVSFAFLHGNSTKYWPSTIKGREKEALLFVRGVTQYQGAALLRGHDMVPTHDDMKLAYLILKEFAVWCASDLSIKALEAFFAEVKREAPKFVKTLTPRLEDPKDIKRLSDKKFAADYFAKVCVQSVREQSSFAPNPSNTVASWLSHLVELVW